MELFQNLAPVKSNAFSAGDFSCFFHQKNFPTEPLILWNELQMAVGGNGRFDPVDFLGGGAVPRWFQWPVVPYPTSSIDDNHYWLGHRRPISRIFLRLHQVRQGGLQYVSLHKCCNTSSSIVQVSMGVLSIFLRRSRLCLALLVATCLSRLLLL